MAKNEAIPGIQRRAKKYELYEHIDNESGSKEYFYQGSEEMSSSTEHIDPTHPFKTAGAELGAVAFHTRYKSLPSRNNADEMDFWFSVLHDGPNITGKEMIAASKKGTVKEPTTDAQRRTNAIFVLLHERLSEWLHKYGLPNNEDEDVAFMHDLVELALEFEFIYDYYFEVQRAQEKNNLKAPIKMRSSHKLDAVHEMTQPDASVLAASFLYKKLEANNVNVLHYPEPKDLVSTMWSETNFIFINKTIIKPCANIWKPCLNHIADNSKQKACSGNCRSRVKYWTEQNTTTRVVKGLDNAK